MRRELRERLGEVEVVGELRALGLLALADLRDQAPPRPHPLAEAADQVGVLGEALDEDRPGALQRGGHVGDLLVDEPGRDGGRVLRRVGEQSVGQRLQPGFARDHRLGAALGLVGQVDVLEAGLRLGRHDPRFERVVELALLADLIEDDRAAFLQLAQVAQALLERAQLRVVEGPGGLLAVPGDERDGGAAVEQVDGRGHLVGPHAELVGDALLDRVDRGCRRRLRACHRNIVAGAPAHVRAGVALVTSAGHLRSRSTGAQARVAASRRCTRYRPRGRSWSVQRSRPVAPAGSPGQAVCRSRGR